LHQANSDSLEHDPGNLIQKSSEDELNLPKGRQHDTNDDERDVAELLKVNSFHPESPTGEQHCDRSEGLLTAC
jgi:hypothetical protein